MGDYKKVIIVDSMTYMEILELLRDDFNFLQHKLDENDKKYRRLIKDSSSKERVFYKPLSYKSSRGFNYVIQFFKRANSEDKKDKLGLFYYVWFIKNHGMYAITCTQLSIFNQSAWHYTIYTPHFIERYRERFLNDKSIKTQDAFYRFIRGNLSRPSSGNPSKKYPNSVWMVCNDGLCLCNHLNNLTLVAKTFVPYKMAFPLEKDFAIKAESAMFDQGFEFNLLEENFEEYNMEEA